MARPLHDTPTALGAVLMRVRITSKPPAGYGTETDSLLLGRIYNLAPAVASALMVDGYAELYETLTADEKRERSVEASQSGWTADERTPTSWAITPRKPKPGR